MALINLSDEQKLIQNEVRKFAAAELEPVSSEIDQVGAFPTEIIKRLSGLGLSSLIIPETYGGAALDTTSLCIAVEELSKVCASIGSILATNNCLVAFPLINYASEERKNHYLQKLVQGEVGGFSADLQIDDPDRKIMCQESEDTYVLSGNQDFVLNGEEANFFVIQVSLSNTEALFILDSNRDMKRTKHDILGMKAAGIVRLEFTNVTLKNDTCILSGERAQVGFQKIRDYANIGFSAVALGIAQAAYDASIKYSKERKQFGRAICEFPMVQDMLVEMKNKIDAVRFFVYDAAAQCNSGQDYSFQASVARLQSSDAAVFCGIKAVQIYGGYGYTKDYPVECYLRDAKVLQLLQQSPLDLKSKIAKELLR